MRVKKQAGNKKRVLVIMILTGLLVVGIGFGYIYSKTGGLPAGGQFVTDENLQDFIEEQEKNGVEVEIVD